MLFGILGAVEARWAGGDSVPLGGPRPRSLLALLLLDAGQLVGVERLIDGLYGADPPAHAANALQSQVSRLRRRLRDEAGPGREVVEFHPAGYRLAVDPEDVDAHRFERLAREGGHALDEGDHAGAAVLLRRALDQWRGPALADVRDAPFAHAQATRLEELRVATVEDHAEAGLALGRHRALVAELQALVAAHPLRERARGLLMRALYGSGRPAEALGVFEDARRMLAEELGTDPSAELAEVHLAVLRADPSLAPARPATAYSGDPVTYPGSAEPVAAYPATTPVRPPAQLTSFVGRGHELQQIGRLLADGRLVTLTGPGGAGKTRLAIEASQRQEGEVRFVDLAPLGAGHEVPQAVLGALGLREAGLLQSPHGRQPDPADRLIRALADRRMLLVLDNCEHVIEDIARLAHRLLSACPGLRVLATSREALGITGETLRPLPPLALPPPGTAPAETLGYPAVRLFADRAAAVRPGFEVDAGNADAVLRICGALDGLPLAIELAAARLRSLSVTEVAARLDDRFRLLSRGSRTAAPRHQTLRAVVEWSWDLLSTTEQVLARRLTVFSGGITPAAAERVCASPGDELGDVDELLIGLADKSLLHSDGPHGDGARFRMLDTVRAFCAERLAEAGEEEPLRRAHAAYFLELARTADPHLRGAKQLEWLAGLTAEHGNLHAALRWAVRADPAMALRFVAALSWYWWLRGRVEGAPLAAELLTRIGREPLSGLEEEYVLCAVNALWGGSEHGDPAARLDPAESIMAGIDEPLRYPFTTVLWAIGAGPGRTDVASHQRQIGPDPWSQALLRLGLGFQHQFRGEMAEAEPEFAAALDGFRGVGDRWGMANALDPLALLAEWRGDRDRALALLDEGLELVSRLGALEDTADMLHRRAEGLLRDGDLAAAQADFERACDLAVQAGAPEKAAVARHGLGQVARLRGDLAQARELYEAAMRATPAHWFSTLWAHSQAVIGLGRIAEAEGDAEGARSWHLQALTASLDHANLMLAAGAVEALAGVALLQDDGRRAALLLGAATGLRGASVPGDPDVARVAARSRELVGDSAYAAAYARGAEMTREEAFALARA
ncbi:BTAD domain-containing putative transcriptional regulator [Actinomadura sp. HBU206391]|uniref:BTAD domain-containing putative transcriptional regulator n=1 Tax=Actinomadura sp. HBU206391 TaxID=2731692 RepID=UPI00164FF4DC|nr:BTAD domain-containing putative transcriptional regulator [Actinomadura sp. HBU206391]MBC6457210.1 tetratricopeptide repeat protein [Actinomadura sp. HBU206391]